MQISTILQAIFRTLIFRMTIKKPALVIGLILVISMTSLGNRAWGVTYQVGPGKPYENLQAVASLLLPGDLVEVDGDVTYPGDVSFTEPGTPENPIIIRGIRINNNRPVISGGTNTVAFVTPWPYSGPGGDHYEFEGFEITAGSFRGIYHQASDLVIRDVLVHDCPAHGILGADFGSGSLLLEYSEVHHCGNGGSQHQIYMATDETNKPGSIFRMQYCYIHDGNGGNNVKSRSERNEIYYNWIEGAYYHELEMIGPEEHDPGAYREDSDVVGNVLWKRNTFYITRVGGDGTGETFGRYRFVNNTFICGTSAAFRLFDGIESIEMHNNVFTRESGADLNIIRAVEVAWASGEQIAGQNNWVLNSALNIPVQWTGTVSGADPGFSDPGNNDVRPGSGSPLVNAGAAVLAGPPGFLFPQPLFPPGYHPPEHIVDLPGSAEIRPGDGQLDIGAFERLTVWYVDDDNLTGTEDGSILYPYTSIQTALNAAATSDAVYVAAGIYGENIVINDKSIQLLGGFPGGTPADYTGGTGGDFSMQSPATYESQIDAVGTSPAVQLIYTGASGSLINGMVVQGGYRGIEIDDDYTWPLITHVTISDNIIQNNGESGNPAHRGGGLYLTGDDHIVESNTIQFNNSGRGAGISSEGDNVTFHENTISSNISYDDHGGGLYLSGIVTLTGNFVENNRTGEGMGYGWGGGVVIFGTAMLTGNTFAYNHAPSIGGGVFVDEGGQAVMRNELIYGNTTSVFDKGGAAVYVDGGAGPSHADIINCTIADNISPGSSGGNGVYVEGESSATLINCILWGNSDDFYHSPDSAILVTYSLSFESITGTGNITMDPLFADGVSDYHLKSTGGRWYSAGGIWVLDGVNSPAIDTGDPGADYNLEPIPNGSRINMGAFGNTGTASKTASGPALPAINSLGILICLILTGGLIQRMLRSNTP